MTTLASTGTSTSAPTRPPADDDIEKLKTNFVVPDTAHILRCPSGEFRYKKTVYVWVRMHAREETFDFAATKWAAAKAGRTQWLRPPGGVQLGLEEKATDEAKDYKTVVSINVPPVAEAANDWDIALVSPDLNDTGDEATERKNTLFHAGFFSAIGAVKPAKFRIDVAQLGYNRIWAPSATTDPSAVVARVRQRP